MPYVIERTAALSALVQAGIVMPDPVLDELASEGWVHIQPEGSHWKRGFLMARAFLDADAIIQTCCSNQSGCIETNGADQFTVHAFIHLKRHSVIFRLVKH